MFPFESSWRWYWKTGYLHLVEAVEDNLDEFEEPYRSILEKRAKGLKVAVAARATIIGLVVVATLLAALGGAAALLPGWAAQYGVAAIVTAVLALVVTFSSIFFIIVSRFLGQLQADVLACMALGRSSTKREDPTRETGSPSTEKA